jgi:methyltransferase
MLFHGVTVGIGFFLGVVSVVGIERILELILAKQNAKYIRSIGGYEVAGKHYKWIVLVHLSFFAGLIAEAFATRKQLPFYWVPAFLFISAQVLRVWVICTLGRHWNTRIFVVPGAKVVNKGLYRYLRHPNYAIVCTELLTLPLTFGLWRTALLISLINFIVLRQRIREEEKALSKVSDYSRTMSETPRFVPAPKVFLQTLKRLTRN